MPKLGLRSRRQSIRTRPREMRNSTLTPATTGHPRGGTSPTNDRRSRRSLWVLQSKCLAEETQSFARIASAARARILRPSGSIIWLSKAEMRFATRPELPVFSPGWWELFGGWSRRRLRSALAVDVRAMSYGQDVDCSGRLVDPVDDAIRATTGRPASLVLEAQRLAHALRVGSDDR